MADKINLASLPLADALKIAFESGFRLLADQDTVSKIVEDLCNDWTVENVSANCGQTNDEFDELMIGLIDQFEAGVNAFVEHMGARIDAMWQAVDAERESEVRHV